MNNNILDFFKSNKSYKIIELDNYYIITKLHYVYKLTFKIFIETDTFYFIISIKQNIGNSYHTKFTSHIYNLKNYKNVADITNILIDIEKFFYYAIKY